MLEPTKTSEQKSPKTRKIPPVIKAAAEAPPAFAKKAAAPVSKRTKASPPATVTLSAEERHRLIAETAYYLAEKRGFLGGSPEQDWFEAAAWVDS